jgi:hypothetical protein
MVKLALRSFHHLPSSMTSPRDLVARKRRPLMEDSSNQSYAYLDTWEEAHTRRGCSRCATATCLPRLTHCKALALAQRRELDKELLAAAIEKLPIERVV